LANKEFHKKKQNQHKWNSKEMKQGTRLGREMNSIGSNERENGIKGFRLIPIT